MTVAKSVRGTILAGVETSYGTGGTPTKDIGLVQSWTLNPDQAATESPAMGQAKSVGSIGGLVTPKGSIEFDMNTGRMVEYAIFGGTTTHADTSTDCTHTMVWADELPSYAVELSFEKGASDVVFDVSGAIFGSSTISLDLGGHLKMSSDFTAQDIITSGTITAATVDVLPPVAGFEGSLDLGGAITNVQSWGITVNRNSKVIHGMGGRKPADGGSHMANVSWNARVGLEDATQLDKLTGAAGGISATEPTAITATFQGDNGVTLGSGRNELSMVLADCQLTSTSTAATVGDFVMYDLSGIGIVSTTTYVDGILEAAW